ncbi:MAG: aspartate aminotransferase family protein [Oscillospiraceae bacterium]|nr:aspartate aminotransferase family protein [Oscillospiraceae bacterium]
MNYTHNDVVELYDKYVAHTYGRFALTAVSGSGVKCTDIDGKEYIDFTSGIGVNALGFCDEKWSEAVAEQSKKLNHTSNLYYTLPGGLLAKELCERSGMSCVFFGNSGAEANEGAIKAARAYSFKKYGEGRNKIISLVNSFHGRTVTTLAATGQDHFHQIFFPFTEGFEYATANDIDSVKALVDDSTCAVMMEMVQGEGGVIALDKDFVQAVRALCDEKDLILIVDEVQTGIGRTGKLFAYQNYDILPDVVSSAKGLGGGLPIGAVLMSEKTKDSLASGEHGSTFGANPICCAGGLAVLERLTDEFLAEVAAKGEYFRKKLLAMPKVVSVSGLGMMIGIQLEGVAAKAVVAKCLEKGLMVLTAKDKVRLLPPLVIDYNDIDAGLEILENVLKECE